MAENLGLALAEQFGRDVLSDEKLAELALSADGRVPADPPRASTPAETVDLGGSTLEELILEANNRYDLAQDALMAGNWAAYGAELEALQQVLERMMEVSGVSPEPALQPVPTPTAVAETSG